MRRRQAYSAPAQKPKPAEPPEEPSALRASPDVVFGRDGPILTDAYLAKSEERQKRRGEFGEKQKQMIAQMREHLPKGISYKAGHCPFCQKYLAKGMFVHVRWCKKNPHRNTTPNRSGD